MIAWDAVQSDFRHRFGELPSTASLMSQWRLHCAVTAASAAPVGVASHQPRAVQRLEMKQVPWKLPAAVTSQAPPLTVTAKSPAGTDRATAPVPRATNKASAQSRTSVPPAHPSSSSPWQSFEVCPRTNRAQPRFAPHASPGDSTDRPPRPALHAVATLRLPAPAAPNTATSTSDDSVQRTQRAVRVDIDDNAATSTPRLDEASFTPDSRVPSVQQAATVAAAQPTDTPADASLTECDSPQRVDTASVSHSGEESRIARTSSSRLWTRREEARLMRLCGELIDAEHNIDWEQVKLHARSAPRS